MLRLEPEGRSLRWYREVLESAQWRLAFRNSLIVALTATPVATMLGTLAALGLRRLPEPWRRLSAGLIGAPLIVPIIIVGTGSYLFFARLGLTQSFTGIILVHIALAAPYVVVTVGANLTTFDGRLLRAAAVLGRRPCALSAR